MNLPFFYTEYLPAAGGMIALDEDNSRHMVQVLRMKAGERIVLTDGCGHRAEAVIADAHKKHCNVQVEEIDFVPRERSGLTIAISLVKNTSRFEWFVEKAAELGTAAIIPLICERTEKQHFRHDRYMNICKSAMLQSSQVWVTEIRSPRSFADVVKEAVQQQKCIAHCAEGDKKMLLSSFDRSADSQIILIGPEGDFTSEEIALALATGFDAVSLGNTRLRTETAGMYAAVVGNG